MRQPRSVYDARWKARHPDYKAPYYPERAKEVYLKNKDKILARANDYYHNMTPEQREEHNRKRRERHARQPEVRNKIERIRDHQKRAKDKFSKSIWEMVCQKYSNSCVYCGTKDNITIEHRLPVSLGGNNSFHNLAPACLSCNSSKRNKTESDYRAWRDAKGLFTPKAPEIEYW